MYYVDDNKINNDDEDAGGSDCDYGSDENKADDNDNTHQSKKA